MIENMNDPEIKGYLENNAEDIKLAKVPKPKKKVRFVSSYFKDKTQTSKFERKQNLC